MKRIHSKAFFLFLLLMFFLPGCSENLSDNKDIEIINIHMDLPEEFREVQENMWFLDPLSDDRSNVSLVVTPAIAGEHTLTKGEIKRSILDAYKEKGLTVEDFEISDIENMEISGFRSDRYSMSYTMQGIPVEQIQLFIYSYENNYTITFTQMNQADWIDKFEQAIKSIEIEYLEL